MWYFIEFTLKGLLGLAVLLMVCVVISGLGPGPRGKELYLDPPDPDLLKKRREKI